MDDKKYKTIDQEIKNAERANGMVSAFLRLTSSVLILIGVISFLVAANK